MNVTIFESWSTDGSATLQDAVLRAGSMLEDEGVSFSREQLENAARRAEGENPYLVKLPGASIEVVRRDDGSFQVMQVVQCA